MHRHEDLAAELPRHLAALRRLACALVGSDAADDVVQETALQALCSPPSRPGPLGGWLAGVLRNVARHHRRSQARRVNREAAAARERGTEACADATASHVETLQQLANCLAGLPEPYRQAIVGRYLHELTPAALAQQTSEPLATVKTRLKRGLQLLRERCATRIDAPDWRARLAAAFALDNPAATTFAVLGTGGLLATMQWWMGGAAAIVLATGLWWWHAQPTVPVPPGDGAVPAEVRVAAAEVAANGPTEPDRVAADQAPGPALAAWQVTIAGRCVDDRGAPLAGVPMQLRGRLRGELDGDVDAARAERYRRWLHDHPAAGWRDVAFAAAADGTFAITVPAAPLAVVLELSHDGLEHSVEVASADVVPVDMPLGQLVTGTGSGPAAGQRWAPGARLELGDLRLLRACQVSVRAVDERGRLVPSAPVQLLREAGSPTAPPLQLATERTTTATAEGALVTAVAGTWRVLVLGHDVVAGGRCEVPAGQATFAHTVVVRNATHADTIAGRVLDIDGRPLAGVTVIGLDLGSTFARTGADGRFVLPRLALPGAEIKLVLQRSGYGVASGRLTARWGEHDREFTMAPLAELVVVVRDDTTGAPLREVAVWRWQDPTQPSAHDLAGQHRRTVVEGADERGRVRLPDTPSGLHLLVVESLAGTHARSSLLPVAVAAGSAASVEVRLPTAVTRLLQVRLPDGAAAVGAGIELLAADGPLHAGAPGAAVHRLPGWSPRRAPFAAVLWQTGSCNAAGEFSLRGAPDVPVVVRISPPGRPALVVGPQQLDVAAPWQVTLPGGTTVELQLGPPEFAAAFADLPTVPSFGGPAPTAGFRLVRGDWRNRESIPGADQPPVPLGTDGVVRFADVPAGAWSLEMHWRESCTGAATFARATQAIVAAVQVPADRALSLPVDLRAWQPVEVQVTVTVDGQPAADRLLTFVVTRPDASGAGQLVAKSPVATDAEGRFVFRGRPGLASVEAEVAGPVGTTRTLRSESTELVAGDRREVVFALEAVAGPARR